MRILPFFITILLHLGQIQSPNLAANTIAGQVLGQDTGAPFPAVRVDLMSGSSYSLAQSTSTDHTGFYTFTNVVSGTYKLRFFPDPVSGYIEIFYAEKLNFAAGDLVSLRDGEGLKLDVHLQRGAIITGRITASDGKSLGENVSVTALNAATLMYYNAKADASGVYTLTALPAATYDLSFYGGDFQWYQPAFTSITLRSGEVMQNVDAVLKLGGKLQGQITIDKPWPVSPSFSIIVYDDQKRRVAQRYVDSVGSYEIALYTEDPVRVLFYGPEGVSEIIPEYYQNQNTFETATKVSVKAGEILGNINAELRSRPINRQVVTSVGLPDIIALDYTYAYTVGFSLDQGATWQTVRTAPWFSERNQLPETLAIVPKNDPTQPVRLLVGAEDTLYRSGDGGTTWAAHTFPLMPPCDNGRVTLERLITHPLNANYLYAETVCFRTLPNVPLDLHPVFQLFASYDAGISWQYLRTGFRLFPSPSSSTRMYLVDYTDGTSWYQSDDNGVRWLDRQFDLAGPTLATLTPAAFASDWLYGIDGDGWGWNSQNNGKSWSRWKQNPCTQVLELLSPPGSSHLLLARCASGLYRSLNDGNNWSTLSTEGGLTILAHYGKPGNLFWLRESGLWASSDQGDTWSNLVATPESPFQLPFTLFFPVIDTLQ